MAEEGRGRRALCTEGEAEGRAGGRMKDCGKVLMLGGR